MPETPGEREVLEAKKKVSKRREELAVWDADRPGKSRPGYRPLGLQDEVTGDEIGFRERCGQKSCYDGSMRE